MVDLAFKAYAKITSPFQKSKSLKDSFLCPKIVSIWIFCGQKNAKTVYPCVTVCPIQGGWDLPYFKEFGKQMQSKSFSNACGRPRRSQHLPKVL
jgi:hypothetical protein